MLDPPPIEQEQNPELWVPDGMRKFRVGDEVRWRISPECDYRCDECKIDGHNPSPECEVCAVATQGHIYQIDADPKRYHSGPCKGTVKNTASHKYFIWIHDTLECKGFWAAAAELSLVETEG